MNYTKQALQQMLVIQKDILTQPSVNLSIDDDNTILTHPNTPITDLQQSLTTWINESQDIKEKATLTLVQKNLTRALTNRIHPGPIVTMTTLNILTFLTHWNDDHRILQALIRTHQDFDDAWNIALTQGVIFNYPSPENQRMCQRYAMMCYIRTLIQQVAVENPNHTLIRILKNETIPRSLGGESIYTHLTQTMKPAHFENLEVTIQQHTPKPLEVIDALTEYLLQALADNIRDVDGQLLILSLEYDIFIPGITKSPSDLWDFNQYLNLDTIQEYPLSIDIDALLSMGIRIVDPVLYHNELLRAFIEHPENPEKAIRYNNIGYDDALYTYLYGLIVEDLRTHIEQNGASLHKPIYLHELLIEYFKKNP